MASLNPTITSVLLVSAILIQSSCIWGVDGKVVQVGGKCGWSEGCLDYTDWYKTTPLKAGSKVAFRFSNFHNVFQFNSKESYEACNATDGISLSGTSLTAGQGEGVLVEVTTKPKYIACTVPAYLGVPPFHCLNGQKVIIQAGLGKKQYKFDWVLGGLVDYQKVVDKRRYKIGESFVFSWTCCHDMTTMVDEAHFKTCNFTGGVELGGSEGATVVIPVTDKPTFVGCNEEPHCSLGQKLMIPAGTY
eukprot:TRINITY_DN1925_c0_g1_i1.p1 TRINITY_DN1925_c0_g1~~TRINITY_DN1925_c0_g1_i1.p1  ORF type:complete len:246 (-),score=35.87 TRINITY_DN1925_c0_g1_i1:350-1087(-)